MNLTNYYWYFKSAIPERICDDIPAVFDVLAITIPEPPACPAPQG